MSKEKRRVPKLRFPGFTEDWEQRKLIDTAKTFIGLVTTMTENYRDSGTLLIRNSDIKEGQFVFSEKPIHLDEEFAEKNQTRRLQIGDVVTVHTGDIGTSAVIQEKEAGAIGFATINTRTDKRILNPYFLSTYFNTEKHKCYANSVSTGDGRSNYNIKDFNKLVISIPTLDEQEKISVLINNINTIITLHQRKLEHLKLKKKALLQKLFPKNGERYPELRFPGFTDAWEQCKLGSLGTLKNGMNFSKEAMGKGYPFINLQNIFGSNVIDLTKLEKAEATYSQLKDYNLQKGDVLFVRSSVKLEGVGEAALISEDLKDTTYSGFIIRFRDNYGLDYNFKRFIFTTVLVRNQIMSQATNSANKNISQSVLNNLNLFIPKKDEQSKIGLIFSELDKCITLHQRKLGHLQLQKKALLQQMFV